MLGRVLSGSRYLVLIAVIGTLVSAITVLVYGGVTVCSIMIETFRHGEFTIAGAKHLAVESIEMIDLFLLGTVLYITALGLYELFIDDTLQLPHWLEIHSLDSLKEKLIGVIVVLLAVTFLGNVVTWDGRDSILSLGVAVGAVLLALAGLLRFGFHIAKGDGETKADRDQP